MNFTGSNRTAYGRITTSRYSQEVRSVNYRHYSGSQIRVRGAVGEPHPRFISKREGSLVTSTPSGEPL